MLTAKERIALAKAKREGNTTPATSATPAKPTLPAGTVIQPQQVASAQGFPADEPVAPAAPKRSVLRKPSVQRPASSGTPLHNDIASPAQPAQSTTSTPPTSPSLKAPRSLSIHKPIGLGKVSPKAVVNETDKPKPMTGEETKPLTPSQKLALKNPAVAQLLGKAKADREKSEQLSGLSDPAYYSDLSPETNDILASGESYSIQELLTEWHDLPDSYDEDDIVTQDIINSQVAMLRNAINRLNTIFVQNMEQLKVADARHPVVVEIGQITKLTFKRIADSPSAYAMLADEDSMTLVRAMRVMADKRQAALTSKQTTNKSKEAKELEEFETTLNTAAAAGFSIDFNLG